MSRTCQLRTATALGTTIQSRFFFLSSSAHLHLRKVLLSTKTLCSTKAVMSFRKRNAVLSGPPSSSQAPAEPETQLSPGLRLSPIDGRPVTSTGTQSLDALLAGQAGFALGKSILFEEKGTTDFSGVLLKYYAAEGLVQGHRVHVFGYGEGWKRELPGLADAASAAGQRPAAAAADDKMKIAWRYEALGNRDGRGPPSVRG